MQKIRNSLLGLLLLASQVMAADVSVTWEGPTTRVDGSPINGEIKYYLYYNRLGKEENRIEIPGTETEYVVKNLYGLYFFSLSAAEVIDGYDAESERSETLSLFVGPAPIKVTPSVSCVDETPCYRINQK